MQIGLFDHIEDTGRDLASAFDERLQFYEAADEAGFYCAHFAEHHGSPLNMVPVPGVFLGALARATKRIRFGPMVYLLPLYSPLRLAEEICILDHLSHGRLEVGVGRGVSPFELGFHKIDHGESRDIFFDAYACLKAALASDEFSYEGPRYSYRNVPMPLRPCQKPMPAFWYGSSNATGATWAGEEGLHFASNGPTARAAANIATFKAAFARRGAPAAPKPEFPGGVAIGVGRQIVVADTDERAHAIARPAAEVHIRHLNWLRERYASSEFASRVSVPVGAAYEDNLKEGSVIAGSPKTVIAQIEKQAAETGINYLIAYLFFGTMTLSHAMGSLDLFRREVMPIIRRL
jgi:alkanesulfonate monooxygenase SsuD/methylene tetrahydromethanopterin reductase-like flavin-dependent oxidoreductase (luciferase family)